MAENILGILFVTSTSRGRNVFRYPPDPLSPYPRLSQPIYPSSTFTARDAVFGDVSRRRLFPDGASTITSEWDRRKSSAASLPSSARRSGSNLLGRPFGGSSDGHAGSYPGKHALHRGSRSDLASGFMRVEQDDDYDTDSDDSDEELSFLGVNRVPLSGKRLEEEVINARMGDEVGSTRKADQTGQNTLLNAQSLGGDDKERSPGGQKAGLTPIHGGQGTKYDASIEGQYSYALGYSLDFLSDMLTPPQAACNRRFELCVDELLFIGHPVTIGTDGQWAFPKDAADAGSKRGLSGEEGERRGRRREAVGQSHLRTVVEGSGSEGYDSPENSKRDLPDQQNPSSAPTSPNRTKKPDSSGLNGSTAKGKDGEDDCPTLNMFHMVLIVDKPDPQVAPSGGTDHIAPSEGYEEMYREIAFKWTAAAYALQVKDNWVARASWDMAKGREKAMSEGVSVAKCCLSMYHSNPLERALQDLAFSLWKFRTSPVNPLYTHLPSTVTVHLADLPISMVLSPRTGTSDESWAHWGSSGHEHEYDAESDVSSDSDTDILGYGGERGPAGKEMRVEPWQTLLLVEDSAKERAKEVASAVVGAGSWTPTRSRFSIEESDQTQTPAYPGLSSRRGSKETQVEEDESNLMKALIEACDVTKPLADVAHTLRFDLDGIVCPLARELVQNKKAILIDVINQRLRTLVMPSTIVEHSTSLEEYITKFSMIFPSLPTLPAYLSQISAAPTPFRDIIPTASDTLAEEDIPDRQVYLDSLIWLLKHDLLIQVHTHVRIWARAEVKEIAWRRLWARRRARWIASRAGSVRGSNQSSAPSTVGEQDEADDLITPRADKGNPMDDRGSKANGEGTITSGSMAHIPTRPSSFANLNLDQSFMDYDPELEMDSDIDHAEGIQSDLDRLEAMNFSIDKTQPDRADMPKFEGTFVLRPARAVKEEMRWLRVIREGADEVWASKFDLCVQYFDGQTSFEEISYRTGLRMREIDWIVKLFKEDVVVFLHP